MFKPALLKYLEKIPDNEPLFLIRAQDCLSAKIVGKWAEEAGSLGVPRGKVMEALSCSHLMSDWLRKKLPD